MPTKKVKTPIIPDKVYHIYNRGNNFCNVFIDDEDYLIFLDLIRKYLIIYVDLYAFVLIPNHYHLLLRINENIEGSLFSKQIQRLLISYTFYFNKKYCRSGSLFLKSYKRLMIEDEDYLKHLVYYIHCNPTKHQLVEDFQTYKFSSYHSFLSNKKTNICKSEVFDWFASFKDFLDFHEYKISEDSIEKFTIE